MGANAHELETVLGHSFADGELLMHALRHASAVEERVQSNERLEFLGDRVSGLVVAEILYRRFPDGEEGPPARRFAGLTSREALATIAGTLTLDRYIQAQPSDAETEKRSQASLNADTMEAILGALYLDGGLEPARLFIAKHWENLIGKNLVPPKDAKTMLQEWAQARGLGLPEYSVVAREGPDHAPVFTVRVSLKDQPELTGRGGSRRIAEQAAATALLKTIQVKP